MAQNTMSIMILITKDTDDRLRLEGRECVCVYFNKKSSSAADFLNLSGTSLAQLPATKLLSSCVDLLDIALSLIFTKDMMI